jgi:hypothetical protein
MPADHTGEIMSGTYEEKLSHVGTRLDEARVEGKSRIEHLVDRVEHALETLRGELDEVKVQAALGKLEARDASQGFVDTLRNRSLDARVALHELRDELGEARDGVSLGAQVALEDIEVGVDSAKHAFD